VQPRFLFIKRGEAKEPSPIVILQQPQNQGSDKHHHHQSPPYWPDYYSYPPPPPRPQRPPYQIPGLPGLSEYLGNGPSIVIINPNNVQNLSYASVESTTAATTGGRSGFNRRSSDPIVNLLQETILDDDSEVVSAADNVEADGVVTIPQQIPQPSHYGAEERNDEFGENELALLERQAERGLNPKNLISFLMQDKRRRRVQEAIAGIYLRNYNLNRK
ncbi:hypothetical protein KR044_007789, partial [Drosophila immigrans]